MTTDVAQDIELATTAQGFTPLGWFHLTGEDGMPAMPGGTPALTAMLVGNAGPEMWQRFADACDPQHDLIDDWSRNVLSDLADRLGAVARFPFEKPPLPFQRWAARTGRVHTSPLGMSIHPEFGLWHAYRAAFAFAEHIPLPAGTPSASPCNDCADKPCLSTCPVGAFSGTAYDVPACAAHIATTDGTDCMDTGCRARRACPVGHDYIYDPAQARFHMTAFARAWTNII